MCHCLLGGKFRLPKFTDPTLIEISRVENKVTQIPGQFRIKAMCSLNMLFWFSFFDWQ